MQVSMTQQSKNFQKQIFTTITHNTCCMYLHNICILRGDEVEDDDSSDDENDNDDDADSDQVAFGQGRIVQQALTTFLAD